MTCEELKLKLSPCAHCGKIPEVYFQDYDGDKYVLEEFLIECSCGIGSVTFDKADKIISDWNRRGKELKELYTILHNKMTENHNEALLNDPSDNSYSYLMGKSSAYADMLDLLKEYFE